MKYTHVESQKEVLFQTIKPLGNKVVHIECSVELENTSEVTFQILSKLLLSGTKRKNKNEIYEYIQRNGLEFEVSYDNNHIHIHAKAQTKKLKEALALIDEIIFESTLPKNEFEHYKILAIEKNREASDDAKRIALINFNNQIFDKKSSRRLETLVEQKKNIHKTSLAKIRADYKKLPAGEWIISSVCGLGERKHFEPLLKKLSRRSLKVVRDPEIIDVKEPCSVFTTVSGKTNVEVMIGNVIPISVTHPDYVAISFGLSVLGKIGGFAGRLMSIVREKEGLTYGIYARMVHFDTASSGYWQIFTFFSARDLAKGIASTKREVARIVENGITEKELNIFKKIYKNQILLAHESNNRRLSLYHNLLLSGQTEEDLLKRFAMTEKLTRKEVGISLKKHLKPGKLIITGAGPVTKHGDGITQ